MTDFDEVDTAPFERCDGIHDEDAPVNYLCTRCFPHGKRPDADADGDLAPEPNADDRRAEQEEID